MNFDNYFPVWNELNTAQKKLISDNLITQHVKKGTVIHNGNLDCTGLLLVKTGQLRTYILSDEGREITLYRLFDMDMCLLSCFLQALFGEKCKIFLENVASPNWRKLQGLGWQLFCQLHSHCRPYLVVIA